MSYRHFVLCPVYAEKVTVYISTQQCVGMHTCAKGNRKFVFVCHLILVSLTSARESQTSSSAYCSRDRERERGVKQRGKRERCHTVELPVRDPLR